MFFARSVLVCAFLATLLIGCKKAETPMLNESTGSIAAPASTMPSPDAQIPSIAPEVATGSGDANGPTQANPSNLTQQQEASSMPLPGQANDHSTPATAGEKK